MKGTVKSLQPDLGLFVAISDVVDGVVWPVHFSDIRLKHPERKFKVGNPVKCRVSTFFSFLFVVRLYSALLFL